MKESDLAFYKDIVPLSEIEKRWLLSVINDSKIGYFLRTEEIEVIQKCMQEEQLKNEKNSDEIELTNIKPLPIQYIKCFDRYYIQDTCQEKKYVMMLTRAIINSETVFIHYHTSRGNIMKGNYNPILLEFSKDHNRFQGYFENSATKRIVIFNLSSIQDIENTEKRFDVKQAKENLETYLEQQSLSTEIQFRNEKNTADRILTEFAPWKKVCTYDKKSGIYQLKIDYLESDQLDLMIRLMGYGPIIQFKKDDDPIYREIKRRLECQLRHINENEC